MKFTHPFVIIVVTLFLLTAVQANGGPYEDGVAADNERNYAVSFLAFQEAVRQGHVKAHLKLANHYRYGKGTPKSSAKAIEIYETAAVLGEPSAYYEIGYMYKEGEGVAKSDREAVKWYRKAAEHDYFLGQYALGQAYRDGKGIERDLPKALHWFEKGAAQGHAMSMGSQDRLISQGVKAWQAPTLTASTSSSEQSELQTSLTTQQVETLYRTGNTAFYKQDYARAADKLTAAAQHGHAGAQLKLARLYYGGFGVPKSYAKAEEWALKSGTQGDVDAQNYLGDQYGEYGNFPRSWENSARWHKRAANQGDATSQFELGKLYYHGKGVAQSYDLARHWFGKAKAQGNQASIVMLEKISGQVGKPYAASSSGTPTISGSTQYSSSATSDPMQPAQQGFDAFEAGNYSLARQILGPHAEGGNGDAQNVLGIMYLDGLGVSASDQRAEFWFRKAANEGNAAGLFHLGGMIYYQRAAGGVDPYGTAKSLLERAAGQGSAQAKDLLATMEEHDRQRRIREKKEYEDSLDEVGKGCRNPRYRRSYGRWELYCE